VKAVTGAPSQFVPNGAHPQNLNPRSSLLSSTLHQPNLLSPKTSSNTFQYTLNEVGSNPPALNSTMTAGGKQKRGSTLLFNMNQEQGAVPDESNPFKNLTTVNVVQNVVNYNISSGNTGNNQQTTSNKNGKMN
jgi:hypothetical protein